MLAVGGAPGLGGPGGFDGGFGDLVWGLNAGGDGKGPGGGINSLSRFNAALRTTSISLSSTNIYGNALCVPLVGGSGGAGTFRQSRRRWLRWRWSHFDCVQHPNNSNGTVNAKGGGVVNGPQGGGGAGVQSV